jgi:threonine dehydratase
MKPIEQIPIDDIYIAQERIKHLVTPSPMIQLPIDDAPAEIYLKLENLQPIGSFKLRGATNAIESLTPKELANGLCTPSTGNMAQGVAWNAKRLGISCEVIVPDSIPLAKLNALQRMGANIIQIPFDDWWNVLMTHQFDGAKGYFIHPVSNPVVITGHGVIGLEILEDLPDVDTILVPYGGGGLTSGIGSAIRSLKPDTKLFACEAETGAPLAPSLAAGSPQNVDHTESFIGGGIGGKTVLPELWDLVRSLVDGSLVMSLEEIADSIRLIAERCHVIAEGAGATPVAAALSGQAGDGKIVCVVSGGNINTAYLVQILQGITPE